jgi:hypothetical protein
LNGVWFGIASPFDTNEQIFTKSDVFGSGINKTNGIWFATPPSTHYLLLDNCFYYVYLQRLLNLKKQKHLFSFILMQQFLNV